MDEKLETVWGISILIGISLCIISHTISYIVALADDPDAFKYWGYRNAYKKIMKVSALFHTPNYLIPWIIGFILFLIGAVNIE